MTLIGIISILIFSLLFTGIFVFGLGAKGPWGSSWTFFLIVALTLSAMTLWVPPAGPMLFGAAWMDLLMTGLFVSIIMSAATPSHREYSNASKSDVLSAGTISNENSLNYQHHGHPKKSPIATGGFFWMLLLFLCVLIIVGAV